MEPANAAQGAQTRPYGGLNMNEYVKKLKKATIAEIKKCDDAALVDLIFKILIKSKETAQEVQK